MQKNIKQVAKDYLADPNCWPGLYADCENLNAAKRRHFFNIISKHIPSFDFRTNEEKIEAAKKHIYG